VVVGLYHHIWKHTSDDLGDVTYWTRTGTPGAEYINMDKYDYYFNFHHTQGDYMTIFKPDDIDYVAAVFASIAYVISDLDAF
jgi:hypothetical protein